MKKFFEDTSSSKMLTPELSYRNAIRHMRNTALTMYELRDYTRKTEYLDYFLLNAFQTKQAALVAKSFGELELGHGLCVVAVDPYFRSEC